MSVATKEERATHLLIPALIVVVLASLDLTVIAPILPRILSDMRVNSAEADRYVWIVSGYLLAYTLTIPLMGRLSDLIGRRPTFIISLAIFLAGSGLCAEAHSLTMTIVARSIQGAGGGAMVPVAMALVGDVLPSRRRAGALGMVAAADTLGWVLGPIWGAIILKLSGGWRAIFWLNIPIGLIIAGILLFYWRGPSKRRGFVNVDLPGAFLLVAGLICFCLGITAGGDASVAPRALGATPNPLATYRWPLLAAGIVLLIVFVVVEHFARNPLIPLSLVAKRHFSAANITNFLVGAALMTAMVNVPLIVVLIVESGRDSTISAELLAAFSLSMAITALIGGKIADRAGFVRSSAIGLIVAAIGFYLMSQWSTHLHEGRMAIDLAIAGAGLGLVLAPVAAAAIDAAHDRDIGIASGLVIVARLLGMTIGISALTAWSVARLNSALQALPTITQKPGETLAHYLQRQETLATQQAIPATVHVIRDTFGVAAILCLVAIIPVLFLAARESKQSEPVDEVAEPE